MAYEVNGQTVEHDEEGYITNLGDWSKELAEVIAKAEDIEMGPANTRSRPARPCTTSWSCSAAAARSSTR